VRARAGTRAAFRQVENGEFRITLPTSDTIEEDVEALLKFWEAQWAAKLAARYNPRLPYGMMSNFRNMLLCCFSEKALFLPMLWQGENRVGIQASLIDWKNRSLISLLNGRDLGVKRPPPDSSCIFIASNGASRTASRSTICRPAIFPTSMNSAASSTGRMSAHRHARSAEPSRQTRRAEPACGFRSCQRIAA
jgi:hypothetical protein